MHADSFLYISRVAASKNHTFFNHFLCLQLKHYRESSDIFARCLFPYVTLHVWPSGGLMRTMGEKNDKTVFTSSARKKKKDSIFFKIFSKMSSLKIWKSTKRKQIEGLGAL